MLLSLALIILVSLSLATIFKRIKLPGILGMLLTGVILGPFVLDVIDPTIISQQISEGLREIALIVILIRAGLSLDLKDLKEVGRPAILLSFLPATIEILAITFIAPIFFDISYLSALTMGAIVAAVSPAIVVPRMIKLIEQKYGRQHRVPQMILAGASIDDIYAIIIFTAAINLQQGQDFSFITILNVPVSIGLGGLFGVIIGLCLTWFFKKFHVRDTIKVMLIFAVGFLCVTLEDIVEPWVAISGLLAVMALAMTINQQHNLLSQRLIKKFEKIWVAAEIMLFVLVGALVNIHVLVSAGLFSVLLIVIALIFRMIAAYLSTVKTTLTTKERLFTVLSYTPKATVQAAIGAIPLALGLAHGELILLVSVLAIVITAPFGAVAMDNTYKRLLTCEMDEKLKR